MRTLTTGFLNGEQTHTAGKMAFSSTRFYSIPLQYKLNHIKLSLYMPCRRT